MKFIYSDAPLKKPVSVQDLTVKDKRGRQRFHGAFTGGFSAGYFNSVGSKDGKLKLRQCTFVCCYLIENIGGVLITRIKYDIDDRKKIFTCRLHAFDIDKIMEIVKMN